MPKLLEILHKRAGMDTSFDSPKGLRQRNPEATLSSEGEESNAKGLEVIDDLLQHKSEMKRRCDSQLGQLFPASIGKSYGRARAVGMTATEASRIVSRAFGRD